MSRSELITAILNTLFVGTGTLLSVLPIALFLALMIGRSKVIGYRLAWLLLSSQLILPLAAIVGAWSAGFGTQGWWPLAQAMVVRSDLASLAAVTFMHSVAAIPSATFILLIGLHWVRNSQEEMALVDGGLIRVLRSIVLPSLHGWIAIAAVWTLVPVLTEMVVTNLYQVPTVAEQIYLHISLGTATPTTFALSIALCTTPLLLLAFLVRNFLPQTVNPSQQIAQHVPSRWELGSWRIACTVLLWTIVLCLVAVPTMNLILKAGWESLPDASGNLVHCWTRKRFLLTLWETSQLFTEEVHWTVQLACGSASVALFTAALLRWLMSNRVAQRIISVLCMILVAVPGPVVASMTSWGFLSSHLPGLPWLYDHTLAAPIFAQQSRLLPLAWLLSGAILSSISQHAWDMSLVDNLKSRQRFWHVIVRPTWRLWCGAWLSLWVLSAGELSTHLLLLPPGVTTLVQRLFEFLHFGMRYQDSGLCLVMMALGWVVAIFLWNTRVGRI